MRMLGKAAGKNSWRSLCPCAVLSPCSQRWLTAKSSNQAWQQSEGASEGSLQYICIPSTLHGCVCTYVCVCAQTHECTPMGMGCHAECASRDQTRQGQWLHLWVNNTRVAVWMADGSLASSTRKFIGESPSSWFLINFNVFFCCLNLPVASWG